MNEAYGIFTGGQMSRCALYTYWWNSFFFSSPPEPRSKLRNKGRPKQRDLLRSPLFLFNGLWSNESKWQVTRRALAKGNNVAPQFSLSPPVHICNDLTHQVPVCIAGLNLAMDQRCLLKQIEVTTPRTPCGTVAVCWGLLFFLSLFIHTYIVVTPENIRGHIRCADSTGYKLNPAAFMCKMNWLIITRPSLH